MAIFDELSMEFNEGLNCITGETGAGKSLVIGALTLLMGAKIQSDLVRPGSDNAVIEALFSAAGDEVVLRREIYATGRSRCFINGELATLAQLCAISSELINIYGQHQYQDLLNPIGQIRILEEMALLSRDDLEQKYAVLKKAHAKLNDIKSAVAFYTSERNDLEYKLTELHAAGVAAGLEDMLESELGIAQCAADLKLAAHQTLEYLYSGNSCIMDLSATVKKLIDEIVCRDPTLKETQSTIDNIIVQIEDLALILRERTKSYEYDPERIEDLQNRLHLIRDLKRKYQKDENGLLETIKDLEKQINIVEDSSLLIEDARDSQFKAFKEYSTALNDFLAKRNAFSQELSENINRELSQLGMPGTKFSIYQLDSFEYVDTDSDMDINSISPAKILQGEFLISTNVGQKMQPLARIASGGELSRVMLSIKAQQKSLQYATMIFDEIDSGISGQTAIMIANKLKELSEHAQAIVITHLHQVASLADFHYVITKNVKGNKTLATINKVSEMDRVMELARMMGGRKPSSTVIAHAKELIQENSGQIIHEY
ncbi:MAG: DNA repair protein RecN [Deltaproteobacteria bacterium]|nr:DNA repair protein RecN [Deltaproteobacteria bacterium]